MKLLSHDIFVELSKLLNQKKIVVRLFLENEGTK
jgi:hypothetical protein